MAEYHPEVLQHKEKMLRQAGRKSNSTGGIACAEFHLAFDKPFYGYFALNAYSELRTSSQYSG